MARKNQPGCPCCNQQKCGCQCQNWRPHLGGTVTDLNGTQNFATSLACGFTTGPGSYFGSMFGPRAGPRLDAACRYLGDCYFDGRDYGFTYYYVLTCNGSNPPILTAVIKGGRQWICDNQVGIDLANGCWGTADLPVAGALPDNLSDPFHSTYTFPANYNGFRNHLGTVTVDVPTDPAVPVTCCFPCPIPHKDLVLSWNFTLFGDPVPPGWAAQGSMTMAFDNSQPFFKWASECFSIDDGTGPSGYQWKYACLGGAPFGNVTAYLVRYPGGTTCDGAGLPIALSGPFTSSCLPFHLQYDAAPVFGRSGYRVFVDE